MGKLTRILLALLIAPVVAVGQVGVSNPPLQVQNAGSSIGVGITFNCSTGITCTASGTTVTAIASGAGAGAAAYHSVAFSATPTFTATSTTIDDFTITLTGNVTSSTLSGESTAEILNFHICQDGTGGRTFVWPTGFGTAVTISPTASACTGQAFYWDGSSAIAVPAASVDSGPGYNPTQAAPGSNPASGFLFSWCDSMDLDCEVKNSAGSLFKMFLSTGDCNPVTGVCSKANGGTIPISAKLTGTNGSAQFIAAALTSAHLYVGSAGNLPVDVAASGDVNLANTGAFTVTGVNGAVVNCAVTGGIYYQNGTTGQFTCTSNAIASASAVTLFGGAPLLLNNTSGIGVSIAFQSSGVNKWALGRGANDSSDDLEFYNHGLGNLVSHWVNAGAVTDTLNLAAGKVGVHTALANITQTLTVGGGGAMNAVIANGTTFTVSGCGAAGAITGGAWGGTFTVGTGASPCTFVITANGATGFTAPNTWSCIGSDVTTAIVLPESAGNGTTCSIKGNAATSDTISFFMFAS